MISKEFTFWLAFIAIVLAAMSYWRARTLTEAIRKMELKTEFSFLFRDASEANVEFERAKQIASRLSNVYWTCDRTKLTGDEHHNVTERLERVREKLKFAEAIFTGERDMRSATLKEIQEAQTKVSEICNDALNLQEAFTQELVKVERSLPALATDA